MAETPPALLVERWPELAVELQESLRASELPELGLQVPHLSITGNHRCGDRWCKSFYADVGPSLAVGSHSMTLELESSDGMLLVEVIDGRISFVEVLFRDRLR